MKKDKAYYVGTYPGSYRAGEAAEILGVVMMERNKKFHACYHVKFSDGTENYSPIKNYSTYKIIGFRDIMKGRIPKVAHV